MGPELHVLRHPLRTLCRGSSQHSLLAGAPRTGEFSRCGRAQCKMPVSVKIDALPLFVHRKMPVATLELGACRRVAEDPYQYAVHTPAC